MKRSEQLFSIINDIDDDIIDEAKIKADTPVQMKPEPRSPIKGIIALAACIAVLAVGVFALVKFKLNNGSIEPAPIQNGSDSSVSDSSSSEYNSSDTDNSDNSFDNSSSSTSDTSGSSENEKIEALIHEYYGKGNGYPYVAADKYEGMYVSFEEGQRIHIPIPSISYGYVQVHDIFLRNDILAIAHFSENSPHSVSFLSTTDQGKSWQSSEFEVDYPQGHYHLAFRNTEDGVFFLMDRDIISNHSRGDYIIYTTENTGKTWKQAGSLSGVYGIINKIIVAEDHYWITGQKDTAGETYYPVLLKSDDGLNWREIQISIDTTKYIKGYCTDVYFSGEMGLATVIGVTANNQIVHMWFSSEDRGETWSFYKIDRIT